MIAFGAICWGLRSAGSKINKYQKLPQFVSVPEVFTFVAWKCRFQGSKSEIFWVFKFSKISSNLAISKMKDFGNAFYFVNYWMSKCLATNHFWRISEDYMLSKILKSRKTFECENRIKNVVNQRYQQIPEPNLYYTSLCMGGQTSLDFQNGFKNHLTSIPSD